MTEWVQLLAPDGTVHPDVAIPLLDEQLVDMYRWMVLARLFDQRALSLQRQGRIGTYAPFSGQEAAQVGCAFAVEKDDWIFPTYREVALGFVLGKSMSTTLLYAMGHLHGTRSPEGVNLLPGQIMLATQIPQAVGAAWASKIRGDRAATLVFFGDGSTSKGDFHEGLNFAAVISAPIVFVCMNNHWAISTPLSKQTATATIAEKAAAYGMPGVRVDGNDVMAVYAVTKEALERARRGEGPTLIELVTYRYGPHTTSDDPTRYRDEAEVQEWMQKDPIQRLYRYLTHRGLWDEEKEEAHRQQCREQIQAAVEEAERTARTRLSEVFEVVYGEMTEDLVRQQREAEQFRREEGR
ncbi:MAG: pyruvate dehydrogenase (acetyl-transferring) E1 component subunit alpha [Bacillaceae bacterium G1]|nr:pyruvate dehydrogenase (acetyl-transferring) E1 component subunit alpha [Bacillota bacterium]OJF17894.1 MAG: pyruvate dehydrogenase (acetyl-transferring) E1 component subunit alpha [Bacillaceae bacterium G1]